MTHSARHILSTRGRALLRALPAAALIAGLVACGGGYDYPDTRKDDVSEELHGVPVEDPYRWLENDQAPEVLEWVDAQNEVTFAHLGSLPERESIRTRLLELRDHARQSAPFRFGEQWFVRANDGLQDQDVLYRISSPGEDASGWEVLLDPNELSEDGTTSVGMTAFTEDGALLAYGLGEAGSDWREFHVMEVGSGEKLDDHLRWIKFSGASWTHDNAGFFYSRYPEPDPDAAQGGINQNQTVWYTHARHRTGRRPVDLREPGVPGPRRGGPGVRRRPLRRVLDRRGDRRAEPHPRSGSGALRDTRLRQRRSSRSSTSSTPPTGSSETTDRASIS